MAGKSPSPVNRNVERNSRKTLSKRIPRYGKVVFSGGGDAVHCSVRDFSKTGAIITMSGWLALPSSFTLYVEPDCVRAECRVVGRKGNNIEVRFNDLEDNVRFKADYRSGIQSSMIA